MNILGDYNTDRHSILSFKALLRELEKIKNSNAPSFCLPFYLAHTTQTVNFVPCNYLIKNPRLFNLVLEIKM
jgi:hypothetical protein